MLPRDIFLCIALHIQMLDLLRFLTAVKGHVDENMLFTLKLPPNYSNPYALSSKELYRRHYLTTIRHVRKPEYTKILLPKDNSDVSYHIKLIVEQPANGDIFKFRYYPRDLRYDYIWKNGLIPLEVKDGIYNFTDRWLIDEYPIDYFDIIGAGHDIYITRVDVRLYLSGILENREDKDIYGWWKSHFIDWKGDRVDVIYPVGLFTPPYQDVYYAWHDWQGLHFVRGDWYV